MEIARRRWLALWRRSAASGDAEAVFADLARRYAEPQRAYHTMQHLAECLEELPGASIRVELALWYHDAVYDPHRSDNEDRSAELGRDVARRIGWADPDAEAVHALILATKHAAVPADEEARLLTDVDLSILGRPRARFDEYERQIRAEYAWVPEALYIEKRREILQGFRERPAIYATPEFRRRYEAAARENLDRALR